MSSSKVVLYSALVVEAPAGLGMWSLEDVKASSPISKSDCVAMTQSWIVESPVWDVTNRWGEAADFIYGYKSGMLFFQSSVTDQTFVLWDEPYTPPTGEESEVV